MLKDPTFSEVTKALLTFLENVGVGLIFTVVGALLTAVALVLSLWQSRRSRKLLQHLQALVQSVSTVANKQEVALEEIVRDSGLIKATANETLQIAGLIKDLQRDVIIPLAGLKHYGDSGSLGSAKEQQAKATEGLPPDLRNVLLRWRRFPATYVILYAIMQDELSSVRELTKDRAKYHLPDLVDLGVGFLLKERILTGKPDQFQVGLPWRASLSNWIDENKYAIERIMQAYSKNVDKDEALDEARLVARDLAF